MNLEELRAKLAEKLNAVKALKSLAKNQPMTQEQLDNVNALLDEAEQLQAEIATAEREAKVAAYLAQSAGTKAAQIVQDVKVVKDEADQDFESDGAFFGAVKSAALHSMVDPRLKSRKVSGLSEGVPAEGGYFLRPQTNQRILKNMYSTGEILRRVSHDQIGEGSNSMTFNGVDETSRVSGSRKGGISAGWLGEGGTLTASKPKFRQVEIKLRKNGALCYMTDEQLQDTRFLESWLNRTVPEELRFVAEDAVIEGLGGGMPLGIMNSPALLTLQRDTAAYVKFADIINMWSRRKVGLDYVWLVHQDVMPQLDQMVIGTEAPPRFVDYGVDGTVRMKGKPVIEVEYAQSLNTTGDIMLAALSEYEVIDKGDVQFASSIHVQFLTDEMAYRFIYRVGGAPLWHSAVTPFHGSNTVSPFVVLGSASA